MALRPRCAPWKPPSLDELAGQIPHCEILGLLGHGGMGAVYRARQSALDREVAVKVLPPEVDADGTLSERFRREGRLLAKLSHPHIVAVFDSGITPDGHLFIVMELASGGDLAKRLREITIPVEERLRMLQQVAAAVGAAHDRGVLHRDLKPSNVLLMADGTVKVADFGLAVPFQGHEAERLTRENSTLGTAEYSAPEQFAAGNNGLPSDRRADVYSLGVMAYEVLTGALPRGVFPLPSQADGMIDPAVDAVVLRALQSDPDRRFASAGEFHDALAAARDRRTQQERRARASRQRLRRRTWLAAVLGSLALVAVLAATYGWWQRGAAVAQAAEALRLKVEAQKERQQAEELIDFLVSDLHATLRQTGRESLLRSLSEQLESYFAEQPAREDTDYLRRKANGLMVIAQHHLGRGNAELGLHLAAEVLALRETVAARTPNDPQAVRSRNNASLFLEQARADHGQTERASFDLMLDSSLAACGRFPDDLPTALQYARSLLVSGFQALRDGQSERAEDLFLALESVCGAALDRNPVDGNFRDFLWNARAGLVECREAGGELTAALADNENVIAAFRELLDEWPDYETLFLAHVENLKRKTRLLLKLGRPGEADTFSRQAITVLREQLLTDPSGRSKLELLTTLLQQQAEIRSALGDAAGAVESLTEVRGVCERVILVAPWVSSLYDRRAEARDRLAASGLVDAAAEAVFQRRYCQALLVTIEPAQGGEATVRRLLAILREAGQGISAAEGNEAAGTWWAEQVRYLRQFLPGSPALMDVREPAVLRWDWLVAEMAAPQAWSGK